MAMMRRWDYQVESIARRASGGPLREFRTAELKSTLDKMGAEGWELVAVEATELRWRLFLKRERM